MKYSAQDRQSRLTNLNEMFREDFSGPTEIQFNQEDFDKVNKEVEKLK